MKARTLHSRRTDETEFRKVDEELQKKWAGCYEWPNEFAIKFKIIGVNTSIIQSHANFRLNSRRPWVTRDYARLRTSESVRTILQRVTVRLHSIFRHPADVDLWSGGVSERPLPGSMLGPTFACVIATQFSYSRRGDRFWYELPNQPSSFTLGKNLSNRYDPRTHRWIERVATVNDARTFQSCKLSLHFFFLEQLNEIRKVKLARVICDNTDLIDTIQIYPMVLPDHEM